MSEIFNKPQPRVNPLTKPFWDGVNANKLLVQHCQSESCGKFVFYPRVSCPFCHSTNLAWEEAAGSGIIISNTTIHRPHHDGFISECPYVFAAVELAEGPCMYGKVVDAEPDCSLVGKAVSVRFEDHDISQKMPVFALE